MNLSKLHICIAGGGIGGLAAARALALRGARVTLLEQARAITEVGAGLQISPNGFAVLRAIGLGGAVRAAGMAAQGVALCGYRRGVALRLDLRLLDSRDYHFVHRADLIDILHKGARDAGVEICLGARVTGAEPGARLTLSDGRVLTADLAIGADGLHSVLRPVLNGASTPFFTGQVAWRAVVPNLSARGPEARVHMGPRRHIVSYPLRNGMLLNLVAVEERAAWTEESWSHQGDPDRLRAAFADFGPEVKTMLAGVDEAGLWGLFRHPVARVWGRDRLALLGDAAHPTLPFMAQGACMALEDAWVLADALAGAPDMARALAAYQARREARVRKVVDAASRNAWKYHLSAPPLRWAAHQALRLGGALAPERMVRQFDWIYAEDVTNGAAPL